MGYAGLMIRSALFGFLALCLAGCGDDTEPAAPAPLDPAIAQALNDPLMTDPDLSSSNEGAAAITVQIDGPLPVLPPRDQAVEQARAEARRLLGAGKPVPVPQASGQVARLPNDREPADHLELLKTKTTCRAKLINSAIWAARLPPALPIYPRGATQAATGGDGSGCRVLAVIFTTPVPLDEVRAFYWHKAQGAGLAPVHRSAGEWAVVQGQDSAIAFDLRLRERGGETIAQLAVVTR